MPREITDNTLFYGDNLPILREYIGDETVDLIYLDPPFNSNRSYNVLFKDESGQEAEAQITAFEDTWHWNDAAAQTYHDLVTLAPEEVSRMVAAMRVFIGTNQMMAYLVMMAEAASAGVYQPLVGQRTYPRVQILTVADLLNGAEVKLPPTATTFRQAERADEGPVQGKLGV
jgi:hypothetical protein